MRYTCLIIKCIIATGYKILILIYRFENHLDVQSVRGTLHGYLKMTTGDKEAKTNYILSSRIIKIPHHIHFSSFYKEELGPNHQLQSILVYADTDVLSVCDGHIHLVKP